jgi:hypothetical protein
MAQNEFPHDPHHVGVPFGVPKMISVPVVHSAQTVHLSSAEINTLQMDHNMFPFDPRHVGVPSGVPKMIFFHAMVHLPQTVHLSYTEIETISKWIEMSFHLIHVA